MSSYSRSHLKQLESEAIFVIREVVAQFTRPVLLFSGGKDSIVMSHLARRAFYPGKLPFPLLHIDTGHNFPETLTFRDALMRELEVELIVRSVQDSIDQGRASEEKGHNPSRNGLQTVTLLDAMAEFKFEAALGGARRDEEKARAKERFFSHRDEFSQWDPKNQRPELVEFVQRSQKWQRTISDFPVEQLDGNGHLAICALGEYSPAVTLLCPPARGADARRDVDGHFPQHHHAVAV